MGKEVSGRRGRRPLQFDDLCFVKWSGLDYDRSFFYAFLSSTYSTKESLYDSLVLCIIDFVMLL
jgi:hypothetical protein